MPFCELNKTRLYYERGAAGEPLILVHGSWVDSRAWDPVRPLLADSFEVVVYDRRGHSRSARPPGQGSIHEDVEDLAGLIDLLELPPVHVAGVSWGGSICLRLAAARPELVRSIAIHEPPLFDLLDAGDWPELAEIRADLATVAGRLESGDHAGAARHYFDRVAATGANWSGLDDLHRRLLLANAPTYLDQGRDPDALGMELVSLSAFGGPALVTYGDRRPPLFRRIVDMVVAALPDARAEAIPGTAHDPQVTHPERYARALTNFVIVAPLESR